MEKWSAQKSTLLWRFVLLQNLLLRVPTVQSELAIRNKLVSTELFLILSHFHIASPNYLRLENWSAQKSRLLRGFVLLRSLLLRVTTVQSELARRQKLLSTELFLITSPFLFATPDYLLCHCSVQLVSAEKCAVKSFYNTYCEVSY